MQFTQLAIVAMATLVSARPPPEQTFGEFKFLGNNLKVYCPDNRASIKCYDTMCTIGCGDCYQCIKAPNPWEGTTKTTIQFRPDCSGKCYKNDYNERRPKYEDNYPRKKSYGFASAAYAEAPKRDCRRKSKKPQNAVIDGLQKLGYGKDYAN